MYAGEKQIRTSYNVDMFPILTVMGPTLAQLGQGRLKVGF